jgi:hypothetical protein
MSRQLLKFIKMADRQIHNLNLKSAPIIDSDVFPQQNTTGSVEAEKVSAGMIRQYATGRKLLCVRLWQNGTSNPTMNVFVNQLGGTPVQTRSSLGTYLITLTGAFLANKVPLMKFIAVKNDLTMYQVVVERLNDDAVRIQTLDFTSGNLTDGLLEETYIEIPVYY